MSDNEEFNTVMQSEQVAALLKIVLKHSGPVVVRYDAFEKDLLLHGRVEITSYGLDEDDLVKISFIEEGENVE